MSTYFDLEYNEEFSAQDQQENKRKTSKRYFHENQYEHYGRFIKYLLYLSK